MRKTLFLFTFLAVSSLFGPASKEAVAQCTHLGGSGACPVGIADGSTSLSFNANGTINWNSGGVSGPCCASPSGTETGAGLLNLNNELGGGSFHWPPTTGSVNDPGAAQGLGSAEIVVNGNGFDNYRLDGSECNAGGCDGGGMLGDVFGANPNSGYLCDGSGGGCGSDQWVGLPQPGFGDCGPGGCTGPAPVRPLDFVNLIGSGRYSQNVTSGEVDPFGGGLSSFQDPLTGQAIDLPDNEAEWPEHVKHADKLNSAYVNDEIPYPFDDPNWRDKSVEDFANEPPPGLSNSSQPDTPLRTAGLYTAVRTPGGDTNFADKPGRLGPGTDTSLGNPNGLSTRFQVAKNFGVQGIISFTRVEINTENPNADLTNYVSTVVTAIDASRRPKDFVSVLDVVTPKPTMTPAQARKAAEEDTGEALEPESKRTNLRSRGWYSQTGVDRMETEGQATFYRVWLRGLQFLDFKSRDDAFLFSDRVNSAVSGTTYNEVIGELPLDRLPINVDPVDTDAVNALTENIPKEFQAPKVNSMRITEFVIRDPRTGRKVEVKSAAERDTVLNAMRNGATLEQAAKIAENAPVATPDGLASATSSRTPKTTRSTPAPAGSTPTFTDNRPAIIVAPDVTTTPGGLASANSGGGSTRSTPAPAGSAPTVGNERPAIVVQPTRPEGTSAGTMKGLLNGNAYDIEVIKTPDGRILAVGTGENVGHVFGEVKETSNKLFGDFRREGPWTPPPAKTTATATATATATPGAQAPAPRTTPPSQTANNRVRSQIAISDRDYLLKTGGFEPGDALNWTSTEP